MKEYCQGEVLLTDEGVAKKIGMGWKVNSKIGKVWASVRHNAKPGERTDVRLVKDKREAKKVLKELAVMATVPGAKSELVEAYYNK